MTSFGVVSSCSVRLTISLSRAFSSSRPNGIVCDDFH